MKMRITPDPKTPTVRINEIMGGNPNSGAWHTVGAQQMAPDIIIPEINVILVCPGPIPAGRDWPAKPVASLCTFKPLQAACTNAYPAAPHPRGAARASEAPQHRREMCSVPR